MLPHQQHGKTVVLDLGANVDSDSEMLVQFAVMGAVMAEEVLEISQPRRAAQHRSGRDEGAGDDPRRIGGAAGLAADQLYWLPWGTISSPARRMCWSVMASWVMSR